MRKWIKGNIIFTEVPQRFEQYPNHYILVEDGKVGGIFETLPQVGEEEEVEDLGDALIMPSFIDVHVHAPQWINKGVGLSYELLPWLEQYTFPLEATYEDTEYAIWSYQQFLKDLWKVGTTRACMMATRHKEATHMLFEMVKQSGLGGYIGKVNMDRNATKELEEETYQSIQETEELIRKHAHQHEVVDYIMSPRFVPCTTTQLMGGLGKLVTQYNLPVQSHLCENRSEVKWVKALHPEHESFTKVYENYGLLPKGRTVMAHCVYNTQEEMELLKQQEVMVAHCAQSNFNLSSGIMPLRRYLNQGIKVGLGSDVGAGHTLDMRVHMVTTIQASKMHWVQCPEEKPLCMSEVYYLATKGGGSFFGQVGSFEKGYEFDAIVIEDDDLAGYGQLNLVQRLERFIYTGSPEHIKRRYVRGCEVKEPFRDNTCLSDIEIR